MQIRLQHTFDASDGRAWTRPGGVWLLKAAGHALGLALCAAGLPLLYRDWNLPDHHTRLTLLGSAGLLLAVLGLAALTLLAIPLRFLPRPRKLTPTVVAVAVVALGIGLFVQAAQVPHPSWPGMWAVTGGSLAAIWGLARLGALWWMPGLSVTQTTVDLPAADQAGGRPN